MLIAAAWLLHQYRTHHTQYKKLIHLNETLDYDLPNFLRQCWPILNSGGATGFSWSLDWYGTHLTGNYGRLNGLKIEEKFDVQDVSLKVCLYQKNQGWEKRYFTTTLAEHFFQLLRMNLWNKVGTVQGTFDQSAKMAVFLQHDMKNMLQLITLTADQLEHASPEQEGKLIDVMRTAIPAVRDRAQHMLKAIIQPNISEDELMQHDLAAVFRNTARIYELTLNIKGEGRVSVANETLQSIVDNLLGNYSRQAQSGKDNDVDLHIAIKEADGLITARITDQNGIACLWPERLFEPFWSEHGSGRGIGLYQARLQAQAAGGTLNAEAPEDSPLLFILSLPSSN